MQFMRYRAIISLLLLSLLAGCGKVPSNEKASRDLTVLIGTDGYGNVYRNTPEEFLKPR